MFLIAAASVSKVRVDPAKGWTIKIALRGRELSGYICARVPLLSCPFCRLVRQCVLHAAGMRQVES